MTFRTFTINTTGPSYLSRSRPLSSQETKNFYHQFEEEGKEKYILHSFHGLKPVGSVVADIDRGMTRMSKVGFRVVGETLFSFDENGGHLTLGVIPGDSRCIFSNDGTNLIITADKKVFKFDGATLSEVLDSNIVGSTAVTYLNNQMIYTNPPLFVIAFPGIPDQASGLNAASADSQPDALLRNYAFEQTAWNFGGESVEPWWNNGTGNPPFERIDNQIIEVGCAAINTIAHTDEFIYWLGDDKAIYQASGGVHRRISSSAISHAIESYPDISDATAYTFTMEGMNFYQINFPTGNKTWCLNESLGDKGWFNLSSGTQGASYQGTSLINVYGKNFVADVDNGQLYELDIDTFQNNNETIQRRRITSSINGKLFGAPGKEVEISRIQFIMETGVGLISGQGVDPKIMIEISFDGGKSWPEFGFADVGRLGETQILVETFPLHVFHDAIIRITTSDPVPFEIYSAAVDLRLTGG